MNDRRLARWGLLWLPLAAGLLLGCGDTAKPSAPHVARPPSAVAKSPAVARPPSAVVKSPAKPQAARPLAEPEARRDDAAIAAAGIRKIPGRRLTLYTDLPAHAEIDSLPAAFEQAFPQWCDYFGVDPAAHADWHMTGFLIGDKVRFQQTGLLPDDLPPFQHGYSRDFELWVYEQPSDYYRRHLVLHEGTHGFMNTMLGACGPPWYMEGMAELLSTHRWRNGQLQLKYFPKSREETPMLGRIKIIQEGYAAHRALSLRAVLDYGPQAHLRTEAYAWCWALCALLDGDPRFADRFRQLHRQVSRPDFTERFVEVLGSDWDALNDEWQTFVAGIEYGYDVARSAIDFTPGRPLEGTAATVRVAANRGWQNSGVRLEAGRTYRLRASGRYQIVGGPKPWQSEPGGVTIRYYQGRPLGQLLAAVRPDGPPRTSPCPLLNPIAVGLGVTITPAKSGTLFLKINDSAAELEDNRGEATVEITVGT